MAAVTTISEMSLDGGAPCLDFINSAYNTEKDTIVERLHTYSDLLILAERVSLLNKTTLNKLKRLAREHKDEAQRVLLTARKARQVLYQVFRALAHGAPEKLDKKTLDSFNGLLSLALQCQAFTIDDKQLRMTWKDAAVSLGQPLWGFLLSAYGVLHDKDQRYIKQCHGCEWLFIDGTKNHRRKWCDMQTCGSSEKSKRYYRKKKMNG